MPSSISNNSTEYINALDYDKLRDKIKQLDEILSDLASKSEASRKLRYADVNIEAEREAGRLAPDELYLPQHVIDTNIRREQSPYVQYITQSDRAIVCSDNDDPTVDLTLIENDLTKKLRFDGWQLSQFANIDGFQANGYSIMEVVQDLTNPGEVGHEKVAFEDFAFISDTRDIQAVEMTSRTYYYTKTKLLQLTLLQDENARWDTEQVEKLISKDPDDERNKDRANAKDRSLYAVQKIMFRVNGQVNVGWASEKSCENWLRKPRPLFLGRRKESSPTMLQKIGLTIGMNGGQPPSEEDYETEFPYVLFPYLISENDTISQLKGRVFLDQDLQEAVTSLISSTVTQARRAAGLYFAKETSDPNDDVMTEKNIFLRQGTLINANVKQMSLDAPDPSMLSAINMILANNQNETSQVNFAVNNRKDSRKTAEEIKTASQQAAVLSTVQVVLYSIALAQLYRKMSSVIISRVRCGLINVPAIVKPLYMRSFTIKPAGDTDVIKRGQVIQSMMQAWPVVQNTPMAEVFLMDLLSLQFPDRFAKYQSALMTAKQQQNSQQAQQTQQFAAMAASMAKGIIHLSKHPEMFSDIGRTHAYPVVEMAATQLEEYQKQMTANQPQARQ